MISEETYRKMEVEYGLLGSWAVWAEAADLPKSNIGDLSIFVQPGILQTLNPEIVFVGLNISRNTIKSTWGNFHDSNPNGTDFKLRCALLGTKWWGGYMTDIIKNHDEVDGMKVDQYLRRNPSYEKKNIDRFLIELDTLDVKDPQIIAIGGTAHSVLVRNIADKFRILKIPHYANWIKEDNYRKEVMKALSP